MKKIKKHLIIPAVLLFAMSLFVPLSRAQDQSADVQSGAADSSQVKPAVGRVSFIHGSVSIQRGDSGDWIEATLNTPIEAGDRISTGDNSRAEVQLDYANVIRLDQNSTVKMADLTASHIQVQVGQGLVSYAVFPNSRADAEIDTPNSAVHPLRNGEYRIQIDSDSQTEVTVRNGQAEVSEPQGSTRVDEGQLITIQGTDSPEYQTADASGPDDFDRWNQSRDRTIQNAQSWSHTDRYYTGSEDLDAYGHWEYVPDYGQVWVPQQNYGWAPYRDGTWEWEPYYGWTWVSYEPWGWAPYHYGRWFVYGGNWAWWPGPVGVYGGWGYYPVWSPAYVSFFGWGGGVSFGFGFGNVGWLPCGPGDFFTPWWGFGVTNVTFININIIDRDRFRDGDDFRFGRGVGDRDFGRREDPLFRGKNGFSNIGRFANDARVRAGVTSVHGDEFGHGRGKFERGLGAQEFQKASFMTGKLPAVPSRQSLGRVQERVSPAIARTSMANNQHFFAQSRPSFTPRPFNEQAAQQQRAVENAHTQIGVANHMPATPAQQNGQVGSTRTFQQNPRTPMTETTRPGTAARGSAQVQSGAQARPGWHNFGGNTNGNARIQAQPNAPNRGIQQPRNNQGPSRSFQPPARPNNQPRGFQPQTRPNSGNLRQFTPQGNAGSRQPMAQPHSSQPPARFEQQNPSWPAANWHQFTPQPQAPRSVAPRSGSAPQGRPGWSNFSRSNNNGNYSRPQLDMRQNIAQRPGSYYSAPRSYGGNSGNYGHSKAYTPRSYNPPSGSFGGGSPYSRPSGDYSRPSYSGSYSRPSGNYSRPSFGGSQSYSRPSSGGYSRPSFSGGGRPSFSRGGGYRGGGGGGSRGGSGGHPSGGGHPGRPH